jgi:hypothetical protein
MGRRNRRNRQQRTKSKQRGRSKNKTAFKEVLSWLVPEDGLCPEEEFHGNIKWSPEELVQQALIWGWQEARHVTDAFEQTGEVCAELGLKRVAQNYTSFMNAINRYRDVFFECLRFRFQNLAEEIGGRFWRRDGWVLIGFDGSRATAPRTVSNEKELCAPNYGKSNSAKYRKRKLKGMRRRKNDQHKPHPQGPQAWITMMWHMNLRLPWTWRLGPSNSSERGHVVEILQKETFPKNTLFCGDAGFVGYEFWEAIMAVGKDFLIRVGGNVKLLSVHADIKRLGDGIVLCWPKGKMESGAKPLRLRLVKVKIGKTTMWMLTSVLDPKRLPHKKIIQYYKMRWGIEVEYRGLKQTIDKHKLRCRNVSRLYAELDWSIRAMAFAELLALREQIPQRRASAVPTATAYDTQHRSLANTMRVLRKCMRQLDKYVDSSNDLFYQLSQACVQQYRNHTDKKARYRPKNPDKKTLGEPTIRKLNREERERLRRIDRQLAA